MKKKLFFIAFVILVVALGVYFWQSSGDKPQNQRETPQTQEEAIRQAQEYKPEGVCAQVLVPAIHKATGATYTFHNSCLAPGWESEQ